MAGGRGGRHDRYAMAMPQSRTHSNTALGNTGGLSPQGQAGHLPSGPDQSSLDQSASNQSSRGRTPLGSPVGQVGTSQSSLHQAPLGQATHAGPIQGVPTTQTPQQAPLGPPVQLTTNIAAAIITHATSELPNEACGLVGDDGQSACINRMVVVASKDPHPKRFTMAPQSQLDAHLAIEAHGGRWRGIWHSHPTSEAYPSAIDMAESCNWPGIMAFILSLSSDQPILRAFTITNGQAVVEHPIQWVTAQPR